MFAIKSCINRKVGPRLDITRQAFRTLVVPVLAYGCHVFANTITSIDQINQLQKQNRLACLSLGSVPRSTPSSSMEILYNLRPLDLELELIALKTVYRIKDVLPVIYGGIGNVVRLGHLRFWELIQYKLAKLGTVPRQGPRLWHPEPPEPVSFTKQNL
jgi:hypothetical protein